MREHACEHVMMPSRIFTKFIVAHPEFSFALRKALFHRPAHTTQPPQEAKRGTPGGVANVVPVGGLLPQGPLEHEPDCLRRLPLLTQLHPLASKFIRNWALRALRDRASIPTGCPQLAGDLRHSPRWDVRSHGHTLGVRLSAILVGARLRGERLQPTAGILWNSHEGDRADTGLTGRPELGTVAIETVRRDLAEREDARRMHCLHHGCRKLGLRLKA